VFSSYGSKFRVALGVTASPLAPGMDDHERIERFGVTLRFRQEERIFSQGYFADRVYRVISGTIRLCMRLPKSDPVVSFVLGGNWLALQDVGDHAFSAEAASDAVLRAYCKNDIAFFLEAGVGTALQRHAKQQLRKAIDYRIGLAVQDAEQRLMALYGHLSEQVPSGEHNEVPLAISDVARHLSVDADALVKAAEGLNGSRQRLMCRCGSRIVFRPGRLCPGAGEVAVAA
jgi:CRP-like cAMP-binding protein